MTTRRLNRIFAADGRTVIIALDHGLIDGPCEGFVNPAATISAVVAGGADAILTSFGIAERFAAELGSVGLIVRSDGAETNLGTPSTGSLSRFFGPTDALRIGADALVVTAMPGSDKEASTLETLPARNRRSTPLGPSRSRGDGAGRFQRGPQRKQGHRSHRARRPSRCRTRRRLHQGPLLR
ncbi:MAG: hypothetical protein CM1200mP26_27520 [Acidimicrobiales bacterium]|nr:MAG: hypothetical protein CM1200mP26_27520 [Acidimicrobiales bacterium]